MKQKLLARKRWIKARNKAMDRILARIPKEEQPTEENANV
jgi:hypothetical protein